MKSLCVLVALLAISVGAAKADYFAEWEEFADSTSSRVIVKVEDPLNLPTTIPLDLLAAGVLSSCVCVEIRKTSEPEKSSLIRFPEPAKQGVLPLSVLMEYRLVVGNILAILGEKVGEFSFSYEKELPELVIELDGERHLFVRGNLLDKELGLFSQKIAELKQF